MSTASAGYIDVWDFGGVDEHSHPLTLDDNRATKLINARFGRRGTLPRRPVTIPWLTVETVSWSDLPLSEWEGWLGGARVNLGNGRRQVVAAANFITDVDARVALLFAVEEDDIYPIPVDGYHPDLGANLTNGSAAVEIVGGRMTGEHGPRAGWLGMRCDDEGRILDGEEIYTVKSIDTDTTLTLERPYGGSTGLTIPGGFRLMRPFSADQRWEFKQIGRRCIGCNGIDSPVEWDLDEAWTLGVRAPEALTAVLGAAGGNLDESAEYRYRIIAVTERGLLSDAYPIEPNIVTVTTEAGGGKRNVDLTWTHADPKAHWIDIYRTEWLEGTSEVGNYRFLARVAAVIGSYNDNIADDDLGATKEFIWDQTMPPAGAMVEEWDGRVWMFRTAQYPNWLFYSRDAEGQYWPAANVVSIGGGDRGMALWVHGRRLFAQPTDTAHELMTEIILGERGYLAPLVSKGAGCVASRSIAALPPYVFMLGRDGVYAWDGSGFYRASDDVEAQIEGIPENSLAFASGCRWKTYYLLAVRESGATANMNTQILALDTRDFKWSVWRNTYDGPSGETPALTAAALIPMDGADDSGDVLVLSAWNGRIYVLSDGAGDWKHEDEPLDPNADPAPVSAEWESKLFRSAMPNRRNRFKFFTLWAKTNSAIDVVVECDPGTEYQKSAILPFAAETGGNAEDAVWNFLWETGTIDVQAITFSGSPAGYIPGASGQFVTNGVEVGDKVRLAGGTTSYPVLQLGYGADTEGLVIDYSGGNQTGITYMIYRYDEPEGLWFHEAASEVVKFRRSLPANLVGETVQIRLREDGSGSEFELVSLNLEFDSMDAVPKGVTA